MTRVARSFADRVLNLVMPVKRYRCCAKTCQWQGLLSRKDAEGPPKK